LFEFEKKHPHLTFVVISIHIYQTRPIHSLSILLNLFDTSVYELKTSV